jgi:Xaa-Pro aminopeptidase
MPASDTTPVAGHLALLRLAMREYDIDAVIVPSSDPHMSEYVPPRWQGRAWL